QSALDEVGIGEGEIARHAPPGTPRVAAGEALLGFVVADGEDRMATGPLLARPGQLRLSGRSHLLTLEALVDDEAEHEREARGKAALELSERRRQPLIEDRLVGLRVVVGGLWRRLGELGDVVGPVGLRGRSLLVDALDPVADLGSGI